MKSFFALAVILVAAHAVTALTEERKEQLKTWGKECVAESGVDTQKITALRQGVFSEDQKLKDFIACTFKKTGALNDDGSFNRDVIIRDLGDNAAIRDIALTCATRRADTPSETAWISYKCFRTNVPAGYKTPW